MKQLVCEMCGSTSLIKEDGVFVCQSCGTRYSVEEAKKMMVEGTVEVAGTVKVDTSDELSNLYQIARRAKDDNNNENAAKYYDMILVKDPTSWEASFYVVYFKAMQCTIAQIQSAGNSVVNCLDSVLKLIKDHVIDKEDQISAVLEVVLRCILISDMLYDGAMNHYYGIDDQIRNKFWSETYDRCYTAINIMYILGDNVDSLFDDYDELHTVAAAAWTSGIDKHCRLASGLVHPELHKDTIMQYVGKVQQYDSSYQAPTINTDTTSGGCYVATAVYGSYDCPQVWTLRRYRDYTLAETWHGRAFIRIYYAVSPTLVKWFGHTEWFKKLWKGRLDRMVEKLKNNGVEDTPYNDKRW